MPEFVRIASTAELPDDDAAREYTVDDKTICVAKVNGRYCAMDNACPHEGGPLGQGFVEGGKVVCPWHGWEVDPTTGRAEGLDNRAEVYELRIEGDDVLVKL